MKALHQYQDYRHFLDDVFRTSAKSQGLNLQRYSEKLGLGTSNFKMILLGQRNLTNRNCLSIASALRMSPAETEYFETLVLFNQSESPSEKAYYSRKLKRFKNQLKTVNVHVASKSFLTDPLVPALMVYLSDNIKPGMPLENVNLEKLGRSFKIKTEKLEALRQKLNEEGIIKIQENGKVHFIFDKLTNIVGQKTYLKKLLQESAAKIESDYKKQDSYFTAFTFSTSDEKLQVLRADLQQLMEKHMSLVSAATDGSLMAQACFQVFPISEKF